MLKMWESFAQVLWLIYVTHFLCCVSIEYPVYYSVNISVLNGPRVSINDEVSLYCNSLPVPPINTTYHWRSTVSGGSSSITQYKKTDPNVTLTIHAGHSSHGNYYCIVKYNGVTIGRGHTVISVEGIISFVYVGML